MDCISNEWADSWTKNYYKLIYGFWRNGNELKYMPTKLRNTVLVSKIMYYLHLTIEFKIIIWKFNFWKKYDFYVAFVNHGSWMNDCRLTSYRWAMNLHFLNRIFSIIVDIFIRLKRAIAASGNTPGNIEVNKESQVLTLKKSYVMVIQQKKRSAKNKSNVFCTAKNETNKKLCSNTFCWFIVGMLSSAYFLARSQSMHRIVKFINWLFIYVRLFCTRGPASSKYSIHALILSQSTEP